MTTIEMLDLRCSGRSVRAMREDVVLSCFPRDMCTKREVLDAYEKHARCRSRRPNLLLRKTSTGKLPPSIRTFSLDPFSRKSNSTSARQPWKPKAWTLIHPTPVCPSPPGRMQRRTNLDRLLCPISSSNDLCNISRKSSFVRSRSSS